MTDARKIHSSTAIQVLRGGAWVAVDPIIIPNHMETPIRYEMMEALMCERMNV